nr:hypothetical protein [Tanacetum cinerariifolium]
CRLKIEGVTLVNVQDDTEMFDVNDLHGEELFVKKEVSDKEVNNEVQKVVKEVVEDTNTAKLIIDVAQVSVGGEVNTASIATTVKPSESITTATTIISSRISQDKGKAIMIEEPVKPKKKDQIRLDEEAALKLQVELQTEFDEEQRIAREKTANRGTRIVNNKRKGYMFKELLEKRRKHFAVKAAEEKRNKPPTITQQRKIMCTYLKNVEGKKLKDLKNNYFNSIQKMFNRAFNRQKVDDDKETAELKQLTKIILNEEEVAIDAIPLAVKSLKMVDWKIHKEEKKIYYQIIKADRKSNMYMAFNRMLKEFSRKDLEDLYNLVKGKYRSTRPVEDLDLLLWGDLKTMFEPHVEDQVWKKQHGYIVLEWKHLTLAVLTLS